MGRWMRLVYGSVAVVFLLAAPIGETFAHDWYDKECCSGEDCRPAEPGELVLTDHGWLVTITGETYAYGDSHIRQSKDEHPHICITHWTTGEDHAVCIYLPEPDF